MTDTKRVYVFVTDSEEMANEIRHFPVFVMDNKELRATEMSDDHRLALITAIHMQQDQLAESIGDLSNHENEVNTEQVESSLKTLAWCVKLADLARESFELSGPEDAREGP